MPRSVFASPLCAACGPCGKTGPALPATGGAFSFLGVRLEGKTHEKVARFFGSLFLLCAFGAEALGQAMARPPAAATQAPPKRSVAPTKTVSVGQAQASALSPRRRPSARSRPRQP